MNRRFEGMNHANLYSKYRPTYPNQVIERIMTFMKDKCKFKINLDLAAVDVGCGTGQLTRDLALNFKTVVGVDISESQLKFARESTTNENVSYRSGSGESIPVESSSVELVTCAAAVHWFDLNKFYKEVERVLKPNGCLAIIGYAIPTLCYQGSPHGGLNRLLIELLLDGPLKTYVGKEYDLVFNRYRDLNLPYTICERDDSLLIKRNMTLSLLVKYLSSWSLYQLFKKDNPEKPDPLEEFRLKVITELGLEQSTGDIELTSEDSVFVLLSSKNTSY